MENTLSLKKNYHNILQNKYKIGVNILKLYFLYYITFLFFFYEREVKVGIFYFFLGIQKFY